MQAGSLVLVLCLAERAAADVTRGGTSFSYASPVAAGCSSEAALKAAIADGLGDDPFKSPEQSVRRPRLTVAIRRESATTLSLVAEIALSDKAGHLLGHQSIRSASGDCRVLSSATALAARLILEPEAALQPRSKPIAQLTARPPVVTISPEPAQMVRFVAPSPIAHRSTEWVFGLGPLLSLGASVSPNAGLMAGGEVRWRGWSLGLDVRGDFPDSTALAFGASEQTWLLTTGFVPCRRFGPVAACALFLLGRQEARGFGLEGRETVDSLYSAAGARVQAELWTWKTFGFALSADGLMPLARTQTYVSGQPEWRTPPLSGVIWLSAQPRLF
jgi:hypothetical protein